MDRGSQRWLRRATLFAALMLLVPQPARAYVRARVDDSDVPTFWASSCAVVTIYTNGYTGLSTDEIVKSVAAAAHAWSPDLVTCPDGADGGAGSGRPSFEIITQLASGGPAPDTRVPDGQNAIVFRTDSWDHPDALAATLRHPDPSGRIYDADIEINATSAVMWRNLDPGAPPAQNGQQSYQYDLQTALTHEFGHFLGLAHTCYHDGYDPAPQPTDDQGQLSPDCRTPAALAHAAAVMWYQVDPGVIDKRVITDDDARGVCAIYPPGAAVPACPVNRPDDGCGCRVGGGDGGIAAALLALIALLARRARRRLGSPARSA